MRSRIRVSDLGQAVQLVRKLPTYVRLLWALLRDPRVPLRQKSLLVLLAGYILTPLDIIPDFIPILGQVDDIAVALLVFDFFIRSAPREVVDEHLARIALDEDAVRRDLAQAQRVLGDSFSYIRDNLERILERTGRRARSERAAADALESWEARRGDRDGRT